MDSPSYHTKHYPSFLKDIIQRNQDDLNWAKSRRQTALAELERISINHMNKKQAKADEIQSLNNQINIFERLIQKSIGELRDYESRHKTSTAKRNRGKH